MSENGYTPGIPKLSGSIFMGNLMINQWIFGVAGQEIAPSQRFLTAGALPAAAILPPHAMRKSMAWRFASEIVNQVRGHHGHQVTGILPPKKGVWTRKNGVEHHTRVKKLGWHRTRNMSVSGRWR